MTSLLRTLIYNLHFGVFAGVRVRYDVRRPVGQRVRAVRIRCAECAVPQFEQLDADRWYALIVPSFLYAGGDGFVMFGQYGRAHEVGPRDTDVVEEYVRRESPLVAGLEGRIRF